MDTTHAKLYMEFINVAKILNQELNITPVLYGSLGLQQISAIDFSPQDIDVLVPIEFLLEKWNALKATVESMGYELFDFHEHDFRRNGFKTAFGFEQDLSAFAGVDYKTLEEVEFRGARYRQLSLNDYLRVYSKSISDSYRRTKNNSTDLTKIEAIQRLLKI